MYVIDCLHHTYLHDAAQLVRTAAPYQAVVDTCTYWPIESNAGRFVGTYTSAFGVLVIGL
jgi:hypothetical protein